MKIGITAIGYEVSEHIERVLENWIRVKKDPKKYGIDELYISVCHAIFPETHQLGYPIKSTDGTIEKFKQLKSDGIFNFLHISEEPLYEKDSRNKTLPYLLNKDIDILWLLDLQDEIYSEKDIINIIRFVQINDLINVFKINFKNYINDSKHYVDDFIVPRIWKNNIHGGIKEFHYDNEITYKNGLKHENSSNYIIPKQICMPKHLSWVGSESYLKRKLDFQQLHYPMVSYKWDENSKKLVFNLEYYKKYNKPIPQIFEE